MGGLSWRGLSAVQGEFWLTAKNGKSARRSKDGITWTKPKLGLFEFNGSKDNNIVLMGGASHNFACFKDTNPAAAPAPTAALP